MIKLVKELIVIFGIKRANPSDKEVEDKISGTARDILPMPQSILPPHRIPQIALFDMDETVEKVLSAGRFSWEKATLGSCIHVPNEKNRQQHLLHLDYDWPENLHEFDICILDLTREKQIEYSSQLHRQDKNRNMSAHSFLCAYPQRLFDSRPLSAIIVSKELNQLLTKTSVIILFCGSEKKAHYQVVKTDSYGSNVEVEHDASLFDLYAEFPSRHQRNGKKIELAGENQKLNPFLSKHLEDAKYESIFDHPTTYKNGKYIKDDEFVPILFNSGKDIVGYLHFVNNGLIIALPDIRDKTSLISELCNVYLPEIVPALFPSHSQFDWLNSDDYLLPGRAELNQLKSQKKEEYESQIALLDESIERNNKEHQFLHELIYQTGEGLVKSVEQFMIWLGFNNVKNMDEDSPEIREEDLQIETELGLLVVEIKGIGGTSTDKDCSQISKIRYRRSEERQKFDVSGLYIVNHQRYIPPKIRKNPPFTSHQLNDAILEKRGLLTTYSLYRSYFLIQSEILTKADVRGLLFGYGLIDLEPQNLISVGTPDEIFKNGTVAILQLTGEVTLTRGCIIIAKKNDDIQRLTTISININDVDSAEATTGEVGILLSAAIKKGTELFFLKTAQ